MYAAINRKKIFTRKNLMIIFKSIDLKNKGHIDAKDIKYRFG